MKQVQWQYPSIVPKYIVQVVYNIGMNHQIPSALFNKAGEILKIRLSQYSMHECQTASTNRTSNEPISKITAFFARAICSLSFLSRSCLAFFSCLSFSRCKRFSFCLSVSFFSFFSFLSFLPLPLPFFLLFFLSAFFFFLSSAAHAGANNACLKHILQCPQSLCENCFLVSPITFWTFWTS